MEYEVQKLIKESILKFKECENKNNSCFKNTFIIGGLSNRKYNEFNNELNRMKKNYTTLTPKLDGLNVDELQNFVKCIVYCNTIFNLDAGNADAVQGHVLISDTTILADLTISPSLLFLAQYHDLERNLYGGGRRRIEPHFFLIYNFNSKSWSIIKNQLSGFQPAHMNAILDQFNHTQVEHARSLTTIYGEKRRHTEVMHGHRIRNETVRNGYRIRRSHKNTE
jgi:hypothetical protein